MPEKRWERWAYIATIVVAAIAVVDWTLAKVKGVPTLFSDPSWTNPLRVILTVAVVALIGVLVFLWRERKKAPSPILPDGAPSPGDERFEEHRGKTFVGEKIEVDGRRYVNCIFKSCAFHFSAQKNFQFEGCRFEGRPLWVFRGPAERMFNFLRAMHAANPETVESMFNSIRERR